MPEHIFLKSKTVEYPVTPSFAERFPELFSGSVLSLCQAEFKKALKGRSKRKLQNASDMPEPCAFLNNFKKYKRNKRIKFSLRQIFFNGANLSDFLDNFYQKTTATSYFDLPSLNQSISTAQTLSPGFSRFQEILSKKEKQVFLMFGFQGSGKSYFCRQHLSSTKIISNVSIIRTH